MFHGRTKHSEMNCHFVHEKICDGTILPWHINSKDQITDLLTKMLSKQQPHRLVLCYGVRNLVQDKQNGG